MRRLLPYALFVALMVFVAMGCSGVVSYMSAAGNIPNYARVKRTAKILVMKGEFKPAHPADQEAVAIKLYKKGLSGWNPLANKLEISFDQLGTSTATWLKWYFAIADFVSDASRISMVGYDYLIIISVVSVETQFIVLNAENAVDWPRTTLRYDFYAIENGRAAASPVASFLSLMQKRNDNYRNDRSHSFAGNEDSYLADVLEAFFTNPGYKIFLSEVDRHLGPPAPPAPEQGG